MNGIPGSQRLEFVRDVNRHIGIEKEKKIRCRICSSSFAKASGFYVHIRKAHKIEIDQYIERFSKKTCQCGCGTRIMPHSAFVSGHNGKVGAIYTCTVLNCGKPHFGLGYCSRHYYQFTTFGKILERTTYDKNTYKFEDDICKIQIYDNNCNPKCEAIIDIEDYERIKEYKWHTSQGNEVRNNEQGLLSRFIMNIADSSLDVDHIDHKRLNNRKINLRICSNYHNNLNKPITKRNSSGYKGVHYCKANRNWIAQIRYNNKHYWLGSYPTKEEAAIVYNRKARKLHGEFACENKI